VGVLSVEGARVNLRDVHGFVYLLHLELGGSIRHYFGFSRGPARRLRQHVAGGGAHRRFVEAGARVELVRVVAGTMWDERDAQRCLAETGGRFGPFSGCSRCQSSLSGAEPSARSGGGR
jgi:predicted GIY-YIG superfamily endonuclease